MEHTWNTFYLLFPAEYNVQLNKKIKSYVTRAVQRQQWNGLKDATHVSVSCMNNQNFEVHTGYVTPAVQQWNCFKAHATHVSGRRGPLQYSFEVYRHEGKKQKTSEKRTRGLGAVNQVRRDTEISMPTRFGCGSRGRTHHTPDQCSISNLIRPQVAGQNTTHTCP